MKEEIILLTDSDGTVIEAIAVGNVDDGFPDALEHVLQAWAESKDDLTAVLVPMLTEKGYLARPVDTQTYVLPGA